MYKKILIPTDGSEISNAAARAGVEFAKQLDAEVIGLYVAPEYQYPVFIEIIPPNFPSEDEYLASMVKVGEHHLQVIVDAARAAGLTASVKTIFSDATAREIVNTATKEACDLIFIGSHGRSGWGQALLGSTTAKVLSSCQIPVLVYRMGKQPEPTGTKK
ncbi:nucleotide-binding universal stress UspA family protein [Paucimonas lemoignei]|uniref:Nucleotide-binding universal stress UspA family protein n=1 Tax=Paucimonas lemoignei TaxID=29443 RepID=A0A4V2UID6_PAULE|nr:universal stress protein [Paucimonas lemoignei]TCS35750.1 nucleotide-binding universal stress UspA family protein [Paucimonas lemoignei]